MRLLVLPRYEPLGASSRLRTYQYIPHLERANIEVTISPLFRDDYVRALYAKKNRVTEILKGYMRRIFAQMNASAFDVVWLEKEFLPWFPPLFERMGGSAKLVVDYDDAIFHNYDNHRSAIVRRLLGHRVDTVMRRADIVTAGNSYLADRAVRAGCQRVEILPTVVDINRYSLRSMQNEDRPVVIGWIGSPSTAHYLSEVSPIIERLHRRFEIIALAVGARHDQVEGTLFRSVPWSEATEASLVASFDIGVMPLRNSPWERGKCGYKIIQYMACGVPVVASPVGINSEIVQPGVNGELADSSDQWEHALAKLIADAGLRHRLGEEGRRSVETWYSLRVQAPRLIQILHEALEK